LKNEREIELPSFGQKNAGQKNEEPLVGVNFLSGVFLWVFGAFT
jgi:hypothetical protein